MSEHTAHAARQAGRVLIVPHCSACGDSLRLLLSLSGFDAEVVRGRDAVRRGLEVSPQAVLVDSHLPGEDSGEVVRRLRAALGSGVRLIGVAPGAWAGDPPGWPEAALDGWLRKPVDPGRLLELLAGERERSAPPTQRER
jgi:DNA-binding response OmpR family regulator